MVPFPFHFIWYGNVIFTADASGPRNVKYEANSEDFESHDIPPESHDKPPESHDQEKGGGASGGSNDAQDRLVDNLREVW